MKPANASCEDGHFVCDDCHRGGGAAILDLLLQSGEKDPIALYLQVCALPTVHLHGPEHHSIVPCVLITAYHNCGGKIRFEDCLQEAWTRGKKIPGGACGFLGICGAAAGAAVAFAASGSLPLVGMMMEGAGSYLVAGEIGAAAGMAGSALSIGASMSPMAFIAAPVVLFTGISASMKADENLEKAQVMHSEAESASEQMKNSEILCNAVAHKSDMFHQLLVELNSMFSKCAAMSNSVTYEISINKREFTRKEYELLAVTESLAKAVKTIIDTPILSADGNSVDENAEKVYENTALQLPVLQQRVQVIDSYDYNVKPVALKQKNKDDLSMVEAMRNVSAVVVATFVFILLLVLLDNGLLFGMVFFSITFLTIMNNKTEFSFFKKLKSVITVSLAIEFIILLFYSCDYFTNLKYFLITDIVAFVIQLVVLVLCFQDKNLTNSIKMTITRVSASLALFCIGLLLYDIFANAIGISSLVTIILIEVLYIPGAFIAAFIADYI